MNQHAIRHWTVAKALATLSALVAQGTGGDPSGGSGNSPGSSGSGR